ncbi:RHS repeat protein [Vibrio sagamiensis]|uniref:Sugar-binding protein n=1 Tax=Vibrio sagamiensis NBRC 104589 TaxID=1219064 RepID=A0A511QBL2_9VIBR|nr:RHS repeat protein [Vibrio sagamiensis]PNQ62834.1 RHS repeat protein [Vibrio agarivorans]GEM74684.1 sugar-binding protein [Vibrio sagamiensis NBRC 104589]
MSNWISNAFNFDSFCSGGVDQRTRSFSYQISFGSLVGNWLKGPNLDIALQFSPYSHENLGFGQGWKLNLPRYDITSKQLYLANGQSYRAEHTSNNKLILRYKKLNDFSVSIEPNGYLITYKNGRQDQLNQYGNVVKITQSDGHALYFYWLGSGNNQYLSKVWDDRTSQNTPLLHIDYVSAGRVNVFTNADSVHAAYFSLIINNGKLVKYNLADRNGHFGFGYQKFGAYSVISRVTHPCGMEELLTHDNRGIKVNNTSYLPAVTLHRIITRNSPIIATTYGPVGTDSRNFMGYGVSGGQLSEGLDNLLERGYIYTYRVQKIENDATRIIQTYNQFHLLIEEVKLVNNKIVHQKTLTYPAKDNIPFTAQPPQYALINNEIEKWQDGADHHTQQRIWEYDTFGNLLSFTDENNIIENYEYYSERGEAGCPTSPSGMPHFVKKRTLNNGSETKITSYTYVGFSGWNNHTSVLLNSENSPSRYQTDYRYKADHGAPHSLGRVESIKHHLFHASGTFTSISSYDYVLDQNILVEQEQLTNHDETQTYLTIAHFLDIGQLAYQVDSDGVRCSYTYDALRRNTQESIDDNVSRAYQYTLDTTRARQIMVLTDCNGNISEQSWDGQGRELEVKLGSNTVWTKQYDNLGRLLSKANFDQLPDKNQKLMTVVQTETYEYDQWGQLKAIILPNGNRHVEFNNLATRQKTQGIEGLECSVSHLNNWGFVEQRQQGENTWLNQYDRWGRLETETNPLNQSKHYQYDQFDRVIKITQPDGTEHNLTYAAHTDQTQVTQLEIGNKLIGKRDIDGLGRAQNLYRGSSQIPSLVWTYNDNSNQPETERSLASQPRTFTRNSILGVLRAKESGNDITLYEHDPITGLLTGSRDSKGNKMTLSYTSTGLPEFENNNGEIRQYHYSYGGVITAVTSDKENRQFGYDNLGRLVRLSTNNTMLEFEYDNFDRVNLERLSTAEYIQITEIEWDSKNHEIHRAIALNDDYIYEQSQVYDSLGLLSSRSKECAKFGNLTENYHYDEYSQLTKVEFLGNAPLSDWSQPIQSLEWTYDTLGNMLTQLCITTNGIDNAQYYYESDDPSQLTRITHTHPKLQPEVTLRYDLNGNMLIDAEGRELTYDNFDKLKNVTANQTIWHYQYDSNDRLTDQISNTHERHFEYLWGDISSIRENGQTTEYISHEGIPKWSEQEAITSLLATDQNGSVIASNQTDGKNTMYRYSPFGKREQAGNTYE